MLQRIQSVYLLVAALISGITPFFLSLWKIGTTEIMAIENIWYILLFITSSVLSIVTIFLYTNRKNQFVLNRLNMILNFILIGLFLFVLLNLSGETNVSEKGIGIYIPLFSIFLLVFANKAIKRDEDLVKSVDRIR